MSAQMELSPAELEPIESDYELPAYNDSHVKNWRVDEKDIERSAHGSLHTHLATMSDGHTYPVIIGLPRRPITETPVVYTTAWFTGTHGHNRHTLLRFMDQGIPGVMIGSEGVHRRRGECLFRPRRHQQQLGSIALSRTAHNMHEIMDELPPYFGIERNRVMLLGKSRGAMVGMGFLAYAADYRREVPYADLTAPCFPKKPEPSDLPEMAKQLITEPCSAVKFIGHLSVRHLLYYPSTLDLHPQAMAYQLATGPALCNGEAGDMARLIPQDQRLDITTYKGDFASMPKVWDEIFAHHPFYTRSEESGAHLSLADDETIRAIEARIGARGAHLRLVSSST